MSDQIVVDVKHGKDVHTVTLPATATLNDLKNELARMTRVPVQLQRLTGKPALAKEGAGPQLLTALGLKAGAPANKLMLVGSPAEAVQEAIAEPKDKAKAKAEFKQFPVPFWRLASVAGLLADNFVEGRGQGLEGASLHSALLVADLLLSRVNPAGVHAAGLLKQLETTESLPADLAASMHPHVALTPRDASTLAKAHLVIRRGAELAAQLFAIVKKEEVPAAVAAVIKAIKATPRGDWALIPFGFVGMKERASMLLLTTPVTDGTFRVVVINRGIGASDYHAGIVASESKVKYSPAIDFAAVDGARITDPAWWLLALSQWMRSNDPNVVSEYCRVEVIYDVLLPWLVQTAPADTGVDALAHRIEGVQQHANNSNNAAAGQPTSPTAAGAVQHFATPIRSESSAVKGVFAAVGFMLQAAGVSRDTIKGIKFAVRYEAMMRCAAELMLAARRWASTSGAPAGQTAIRTALPAANAAQLQKAITGLEACGVNAADATITLDAIFSNLGARDQVKNENGSVLSPSFFANKVVAVYFSGAWCTYCKQVTPLLQEAYEALQKKFPRMFEVLFVSVDRNPQEYSTNVASMTWPRLTYPPPEELVKACDVSGVPKLLLFGLDGALMTGEGVAALREDPDVELFPHAPWNGAKPLTDTDARLLSIGIGHVAYHAVQRADAGMLPHENLLDIEAAMGAIRNAVRAMPRRPGGTNSIVFPRLKTKGTDDAADPSAAVTEAMSAADAVMDSLRERCERADVAFGGLELLRSQNTDGYLGRAFDTALPPLGNPGALALRPRSLKELDTLLARAVSAVALLWTRAKHANTASRVAVQCCIMELITTLFTQTIPMPTALTDEPDFYGSEGFLTKEDRDAPPATQVTSPHSPDAAAAAGGARAGSALPTQPAGPAPDFVPPGEDMQIDMLSRIHQLALSFTTAWQSVDVPTRALDSEKCLTAIAILTVFDAIARNEINAKQGNTLAFMLNTGGYHLSTNLCRNHRPLEEVFATLEIVRPPLVHTRAGIIQYHRRLKQRCPNELFDLRMVDKFEVRKYSHTVQFLRQFMEACGYSISDRQGSGMTMAPQSEMEQLMGWLTDRRMPLHREHQEFTFTRDIVLLAKFLATMDSRDSQLLRQKKETDEWATWRISFDEDAPGRQMSAGWRTRPEPPVWELLMVRGRDMDIADITVRGFGDRELLYGEGLVVASPSDASALLNVERPTEDDILHHAALPSFGDVLNEEESVHLLSCLTVGYIRIPLVLDFFTTQDRHTYLFTEVLQKLLRSVVFEPGQFVDTTDLFAFNNAVGHGSADGEPTMASLMVPLRLSAAQVQERHLARLRTGDAVKAAALADTTELLGSRHGNLLNELCQHRPQAVLAPLEFLLKTIKELGPSSAYSANASYALFISAIVCDVLTYVRHARQKVSTVKAPSVLEEYENRLVSGLETLVVPLLQSWEDEAVEADDTPTQCVVHSYRALVLRTSAVHAALQLMGRQPAAGQSAQPPRPLGTVQRARLVQHVAAYLGACAFVRVRHGFGMGLQRTQLAMQQGDNLLSPEQKLLRFLQSQGLDTSRVTSEQLEQGRRLMLSGGRRRALFVQVRSRFYSDTVRVPNLIYADASSTADSKALKLPPVDVPEARLFAMLQDDGPGVAALFAQLTREEISSVFNAVASTVLRDRHANKAAEEDTSASDVDAAAAEATAAALVRQGSVESADQTSAALIAGDAWGPSATRPAVFQAASSGLLFHLPTAELFWRRNELRPVPDSMSHFPDYEAIVGKDILQCGLVARHENRHWVHIVGTVYDLCEWTAPNALDQGVHAPVSASQGTACSQCGVIGAGCWACERCHSVICGHMPPFCQCRTRKPETPETEEEPIGEATYRGVLYNRPFSINDEAPWPVKGERWVVAAASKVFKTAYSQPGELKYVLIMPGAPLEADAVSCTLLANDAIQYDDQKERSTWKLIEVRREPHEVVNVYNLVSHARRIHQVLVYSSNSHMSLHSLAPIMKPRSADTLPLMLHHAGELKKRVQNESTLEIHRHSAALGGRETFIPSRLLQGALPTSILEHFVFWRGTDDVIRGEGPAADDPWYGYALEVRLPQAEPVGFAVVIRRPLHAPRLPVSQHAAEEHRRRLQELGPAASAAVLRLMTRQASAADLTRRDSTRLESRRRHGRTIRDEDVAMVASVFPSLPEAVCRLALKQCPRGTGASGAIEWLTSDRNVAAVRAAVDEAMSRSGNATAPGDATSPTARPQADAAAASAGEGMGSRMGSRARRTSAGDLLTLEQEAAIDSGAVVEDAEQLSPTSRAGRSTTSRFELSTSDAPAALAGPAGTSQYRLSSLDAPADVLISLTTAPRFKALAAFLTERLEDASHVLAWARVPVSVAQALAPPSGGSRGPPTAEQERSLKAAEKLLSQLGPLDLHVIELPRLRMRLVPRPAGEDAKPGTVRLHIEDNPSWWIELAEDEGAVPPSVASPIDEDSAAVAEPAGGAAQQQQHATRSQRPSTRWRSPSRST
jgi:thiol-disulfide isomerase/thioredoxin